MVNKKMKTKYWIGITILLLVGFAFFINLDNQISTSEIISSNEGGVETEIEKTNFKEVVENIKEQERNLRIKKANELKQNHEG